MQDCINVCYFLYETKGNRSENKRNKHKHPLSSWDPQRAREKACSPLATLLCFEDKTAALFLKSHWGKPGYLMFSLMFSRVPLWECLSKSVSIHSAEWEAEVMLKDHYWTAVGTESCAILKHTFFCYLVRVHLLQPLTSIINGVNQFLGMCGYYFLSWNGAQLTFCENT